MSDPMLLPECQCEALLLRRQIAQCTTAQYDRRCRNVLAVDPRVAHAFLHYMRWHSVTCREVRRGHSAWQFVCNALIKRGVKPLSFRHGDISQFLVWGLGTGVP